MTEDEFKQKLVEDSGAEMTEMSRLVHNSLHRVYHAFKQNKPDMTTEQLGAELSAHLQILLMSIAYQGCVELNAGKKASRLAVVGLLNSASIFAIRTPFLQDNKDETAH
jgi:hypothetical protein